MCACIFGFVYSAKFTVSFAGKITNLVLNLLYVYQFNFKFINFADVVLNLYAKFRLFDQLLAIEIAEVASNHCRRLKRHADVDSSRIATSAIGQKGCIGISRKYLRPHRQKSKSVGLNWHPHNRFKIDRVITASLVVVGG